MTHISLTGLTASPAINQAVDFIVRLCTENRIDRIVADTLCLIVEELISNTYKHGGIANEVEIGLDLSLQAERARMIYRDNGNPFDPHRDLPEDDRDLRLEERRIGGLGWRIIFEKCETVEYQRDDDRNMITLRLK